MLRNGLYSFSCRFRRKTRMNRTMTANRMLTMTASVEVLNLMTETGTVIAGRKNLTKNGRKITPSTGFSVFSQKPCRAAGRI